jgi:hypothetical protein
MKLSNFLAIVAVTVVWPVFCVNGQTATTSTPTPSFWDDLRFSGVLFLTNETIYGPIGTNNEIDYFNEFRLERGYITFRKKITERVGVRFTQDITVDMEGDGEGDIELRLKYAFVHYAFDNWGIFHKPLVSVGVVPRPWTDYEQKINDYRMQSSMFLDRERISRSADYGVTVTTLLGKPLENPSKYNIDSAIAGTYGSLSFGVYNGGGYAALEKNRNKVVEGRLSVRPFWEALPGLELTYSGSYGKGNAPEGPEFWKNVGYLSFSSPKFIGALQGYYGLGDVAARRVYTDFTPIPMQGYSFFTEIMPFKLPISIIGRFENLHDRNNDNDLLIGRSIVGIAWRFSNGSKILIDYEREYRNTRAGDGVLHGWEIATEVRF